MSAGAVSTNPQSNLALRSRYDDEPFKFVRHSVRLSGCRAWCPAQPRQDLGGTAQTGTMLRWTKPGLGGRTRGPAKAVVSSTTTWFSSPVPSRCCHRKAGHQADNRKDGRYAGRVRKARRRSSTVAPSRSVGSSRLHRRTCRDRLIVTDQIGAAHELAVQRKRGYEHFAVADRQPGDPEALAEQYAADHPGLVFANLKTWLIPPYPPRAGSHQHVYPAGYLNVVRRRPLQQAVLPVGTPSASDCSASRERHGRAPTYAELPYTRESGGTILALVAVMGVNRIGKERMTPVRSPSCSVPACC